MVRRRRHPALSARALVRLRRLQSRGRPPCLACSGTRRLSLRRCQPRRRSRAGGRNLRPHPRRLVSAVASLAGYQRLSRSCHCCASSGGQPLLLCLQPDGDSRASPHPAHTPSAPHRLRDSGIAPAGKHDASVSADARPRCPPSSHGPHQDHRCLPLPLHRLDVVGLCGLPSPPVSTRGVSICCPRSCPLDRLLRPLRAPPLPGRLQIPLQRKRLYRHHPRYGLVDHLRHSEGRPLDRQARLPCRSLRCSCLVRSSASPILSTFQSAHSFVVALDVLIRGLPCVSQQPAAALLPRPRCPAYPPDPAGLS